MLISSVFTQISGLYKEFDASVELELFPLIQSNYFLSFGFYNNLLFSSESKLGHYTCYLRLHKLTQSIDYLEKAISIGLHSGIAYKKYARESNQVLFEIIGFVLSAGSMELKWNVAYEYFKSGDYRNCTKELVVAPVCSIDDMLCFLVILHHIRTPSDINIKAVLLKLLPLNYVLTYAFALHHKIPLNAEGQEFKVLWALDKTWHLNQFEYLLLSQSEVDKLINQKKKAIYSLTKQKLMFETKYDGYKDTFVLDYDAIIECYELLESVTRKHRVIISYAILHQVDARKSIFKNANRILKVLDSLFKSSKNIVKGNGINFLKEIELNGVDNVIGVTDEKYVGCNFSFMTIKQFKQQWVE